MIESDAARCRPDLASIAARLTDPPVTRFAPSPTGYLHLGHVVNAIYVWGVAGVLGGRVWLRLEDHDRIRCVTEYETALLEDLDWLGFVPDLGRDPLLRQSDDPRPYKQALDQLRGAALVYACDCSRREIAGARYPGRCRGRGLPEPSTGGVRVLIDHGVETFNDLLLGRQQQTPSDQCGDLLLRDRDGHWTYQFAVTVDDLRHDVGLVIRGADLLSSTGRQIRLARLLGRATAPLFLHHPLVMRGPGEKLSKAGSDAGVRELREAGFSPADVIGRAAAAVGLIDGARPIPADEVAVLFA